MREMDNSFPATVNQATQWLLYYLSFKDKLRVAIKTEMELPALKPSLGKFIKEEFALKSNFPLIESCRTLSNGKHLNSDDASQIIIKEFWKQLKAP
ncbi:MAG: hypothetical protein PVF14_08395 [Desulfobacterales bacterium]|jgi:hypothetical protein